VRSGKEQLPARSETPKPGASPSTIHLGRTGPVCERSGMEEHRTEEERTKWSRDEHSGPSIVL